MSKQIILASASPRRKTLLKTIIPDFSCHPADINEEKLTASQANASANEIACLLATAKAAKVAQLFPDALVIGSDTVVACGDLILGKPDSVADARRILQTLSGTSHLVITSVCIIELATATSLCQYEETTITMKTMSATEIKDYIDSGECFGKAGAYAIQENGDKFVSAIDGDFNNVVGLPTRLVTDMLEQFDL